MIGKPGSAFNAHGSREYRAAAGAVLLLALALQCFELHAELLFRSLEQVNGQQRWSPIKKYSDPSDIAYPRVPRGAAAPPAEEVRVFVSGEITRQDGESAAVLASLLKSGKQKLAGNSVWLASNGGDIDAAMEMGRLLRKLGIFTVVGKNDQCLSACVFAFMGGERRFVAGQLGIHRPFFPFTQESPDRPARFRHLQRTLKDYFEEMDFPASFYEAVMLVPPESMQLLDPADLKRFSLQGISPSSEDIADAASARRLDMSMLEYLKHKAKAPACAFPVAGQDRCDGSMLEAAVSGGAADDPGSNESASAGRPAGRSLGSALGSGSSRSAARSVAGSK